MNYINLPKVYGRTFIVMDGHVYNYIKDDEWYSKARDT